MGEKPLVRGSTLVARGGAREGAFLEGDGGEQGFRRHLLSTKNSPVTFSARLSLLPPLHAET